MAPQSVELMGVPRFQPVVLGLLYHVSMDDKYKSLFTFTDAIPKMYEMLMRVTVSLPVGCVCWYSHLYSICRPYHTSHVSVG